MAPTCGHHYVLLRFTQPSPTLHAFASCPFHVSDLFYPLPVDSRKLSDTREAMTLSQNRSSCSRRTFLRDVWHCPWRAPDVNSVGFYSHQGMDQCRKAVCYFGRGIVVRSCSLEKDRFAPLERVPGTLRHFHRLYRSRHQNSDRCPLYLGAIYRIFSVVFISIPPDLLHV